MRLKEICLGKDTSFTLKEIPTGWRRLLKPLGYKKVYLSKRKGGG